MYPDKIFFQMKSQSILLSGVLSRNTYEKLYSMEQTQRKMSAYTTYLRRSEEKH